MAQNLADGQLPSSAAVLLANAVTNLGLVNVECRNTSASLTETVTLTYQRKGGTARSLVRASLAPNEALLVTNFPLDPADTLNGSTTDAATVDYVISQGLGGQFTVCTYDANGAAKMVNVGAAGVSGNFTIGGLLLESNASGVTAGTTRTRAGATALTKEVSRVDTSTAPSAGSTLGDGVVLPASQAGLDMTVINNTANPIQVYAAGSDTINGTAGTTGVPIPPGDVAQFECSVVGDWRFEAGVGASGQFALLLAANGITAGTTRTQAGATALAAEFNRVDTSTAPSAGSTLGDGVVLPASVLGMDLVIWNNTANPIQVYGNGSDTINGVAGSTGVALPPNAVETFFCMGAGSWIYDAGVGTSGQYDTVLAADSISAAGSTQAGATQLSAVFNKVTTATAGSAYGVKLPASAPGLDVIIENHSGVALQVYGAGSDQIDDVTAATGIVQMDSSVVIYTCYAAGKWYTNGAATGYAKNPQAGVVLETVQFADSISAAGSTQAGATQLSAAINNVTTVGSAQGVNLPASSAGLSVTVQNNGANPLTVYPAQGASDTINGVAAATGVQIHPGTVGVFNSTTAGVWTMQAASPKMAAYNTVASAATLNLTAAQVTGGVASVDLSITGSTAVTTFNTPTAAAIVAALHAPAVGTSYRLRIINTSGSATSALTAGSGVTLANFSSGVYTIANNTWREFVVSVTAIGTPAVTMTSVATGTWS